MTYLEAPVHLASSDGSGVVGTIAACISSIGSGLNVWCPGDVHRVELQQPFGRLRQLRQSIVTAVAVTACNSV